MLAHSYEERDKKIAQAKWDASQWKEQIKSIETTASDLARQTRTGLEERDVEVAEQKDYARAVVDTIRQDTGEVVFTRPMEPLERQQALRLIDPTGTQD